MKKSTVLTLFIMLLSFANKAQGNWASIYNENGITISYSEQDCKTQMGHTEHMYLLKIENHTATTKVVEWNFQTKDNEGKCKGCAGEAEQHRGIKIGANKTIEATCDVKSRRDLKMGMRFLDIQTKKYITEVKITDIRISDYIKK